MKQELGETRDALMAQDEKDVEALLNSHPKGKFWIVIFYKPMPASKVRGNNGETVVRRVVKAYKKKPEISQIGTVVLEVRDGEIIGHEINPHDAPIDWGAVVPHAGLVETPAVLQSKLAGAYIYN